MRQEEEVRFLVLGVQREGSRALAAALAPLGLTPAQSEVIRCLGASQVGMLSSGVAPPDSTFMGTATSM